MAYTPNYASPNPKYGSDRLPNVTLKCGTAKPEGCGTINKTLTGGVS